MLIGTSSGVGKSVLTAGMCRVLSDMGRQVAPFKAMNLSLNSHVCPDGSEIGRSQALQAFAARTEPEGAMNPFLIKPKGDGMCQLIKRGRPWMDVPFKNGEDWSAIAQETVETCYRELSIRFDDLVIEGMGSPVEINLRNGDLANMWTASMADSPVVLVGDIERGGVFAALYGTWLLMTPEDRERLIGFVINRFRGDPSILGSGVSEMERRMDIPCLGIMPRLELHLPGEDGLDLGATVIGRGCDELEHAWDADLNELASAMRRHLDLDRLIRAMGP